MDKFPETYNLLLFHEEMEYLNRPVTSKEIELVNKNLLIERSPGPDGFTKETMQANSKFIPCIPMDLQHTQGSVPLYHL